MNVLITGSAGYVGSALIKELTRHDDTIYSLDIKSPPKELVEKTHHIAQDITNSETLKKKLKPLDIDVVAHLAALVRENPSQILRTNVYGTTNLLDALRFKHPKLIIIASTAAQLYRNAQYIPIDEKHPITPVTTYGLSKHLTEEVARFYYRIYSMPIAIFRQTNVYGPAPVQKYTVINKFVEDALTRGRITIDGDGEQVRNFIHIDDLVQYYIKAIHYPSPERLAGQVFNIAGPEECKVKPLSERIVSHIASKTNKDVKIVFNSPSIPPELDIHIFNISSQKAQLFFNYIPKITLDNGIAKTIDTHTM